MTGSHHTQLSEHTCAGCSCQHRRSAWRSRWAAIGAAIAVIAGVGGVSWAGATNAQVTPSSVSISPCRIMDTRAASNVGPRSTPLTSNSTHTIQVTGKNGNCSLPSDVASVLVNVTVARPSASGYITVFPGGAARPTASNLNYTSGQSPVPNLVNAALGATGRLSFYALGGPVDLIADITGYTTTARLSNADVAQNRWDRDLAKPSTVGAGITPSHVAFDGSNIWVTNFNSRSVSKINPATNTVIATVAVGTGPLGVAFDGTNIWVCNYDSGTVSKINPRTNSVTATVSVGDSPIDVAFDGTSVWVVNRGLGTVSKINPTTNTVTATVTVGTNPNGVAFDGANIWVTNGVPNTVSKINPTTNAVIATVVFGLSNPNGIAFDGTSIWVANRDSGTVSKINLVTNTVRATVTVGDNPVDVAFDGTSVWVTNDGSGTVSKIDPSTDSVIATVRVGDSPLGVAFDGTSIWVANQSSETVTKLRAG